MTHTAGDIASQALRSILVEAGDSPLQPDEYADFLYAMNNWMAGLEAKNIKLGYTSVDNVADVVTVPDGAIEGIIANMAIRVSTDYGGKISGPLVLQAKEGMANIRRLGMQMGLVTTPSNMPNGAGNYSTSTTDVTSPFYRQTVGLQMSLSENALVTDIVSAGVWVKVNGVWNVGAFRGLSVDITGKITNTGPGDVDLSIETELTVVGADTVAASLWDWHINGVAQGAHVLTGVSTTAKDTSWTQAITLSPGEYAEMHGSDFTGSVDMTATNCQVKVN